VRGSAVNQDGRSNGLMAPNPAAQVAALRAACADAGVQPRDIDYVETHGTGTLLGDPIEARALGMVYGRGRAETSPLLLGALKTNLGHLEAAAGIAGFIKATLAVQRGQIPPNQHFAAPNPHIAFPDMRLKVVATHTPWPASDRPRRAGVSSFGFGGTNAHVVVEQAPVGVVEESGPGPVVSTLVVSGKSVARVASWASVLADWWEGAGAAMSVADVAHGLNHHRARHGRFATVAATDRAQAVAGLRALAAGELAPGVVLPHEGPCGPGVVLVYSGQGSQWAGMGARLLADEPAFAAAIAELEPVFVEQVGFSLHGVLAGEEPVAGIDRIQPVLVGVQLGLTALWRSYGVSADAVIGHSMGEVTAAVVAGALTPTQGLRVIATRSRLMARLAGRGAMALVELDAAEVDALLADYPQVGIAVEASPRQTVIAGPPEQVDALIAVVAGGERLARRVEVDVASHHRIIDPVLPQLRAALADLEPAEPTIAVIGTVDYDEPRRFDADYWAANLRRPVRFARAITTAAAEHATFIEVSPHPLLTHAIGETLAGVHHHAVPTLIRDTHDTLTFHTHLNTTHTTHPPHTPHPPEPHAQLPTIPWHHTHHWITPKKKAQALLSAPEAGTLLGEHMTLSSTPPAHLWQARLIPEAKPYPGYHRLHGVEVVPASVLLQTMFGAAAALGIRSLSGIRFEHPITVDRPKVIQVVADHESVSIASSSATETPVDRWTRHATAQLSPFVSDAQAFCTPESNGQPRNQTVNGVAVSITELLCATGVEGQPFPWSVGSCRPTSGGLLAHVDLTEESKVALLDAALHVAPMAGATDSRLYVPVAVEHVRLGGAPTHRHGSVSVRHTGGAADEVIVDVAVGGHNGESGISLCGLRYVALEAGGALADTSDDDPRSFAHAIEWRPWQHQGDPRDTTEGLATVAVIGGEARVAADLGKRLAQAGYAPGEVAKARYVLYIPDIEPTDDAEADVDQAVRMSATVTSLVRGLAERSEHEPGTLWILTTGVQEAENRAAVQQSPLWGLAGVIAAEHPEVWGGLVDFASADEIGETANALAKVLATRGNTVLVLRDGVFHSPELVPVTGEPVRDALRCKADGAYLITGGLGALGLLMAGWLADRGAHRVLLAGRTPLPPRRDWNGDIDIEARQKISAIRELERRGVSVEVVTLDIGSTHDLHALLARRDRDGAPPIRGVIHAAGVTDNQLVASTTQDSIRKVMWPKISGGCALHEAFPCGSLDFFFLMSSAASIFGIQGQGSYAAANAYLDALARARHRRGCHTLSLDWAAWRGLGFASDAQIVVRELQRLGSREITPEEAFTAWEHVATYDIAQAVVVPLPSPVGEDRSAVSDVLSPAGLRAWSQMSATDLHDELANGIRTIIARELRLPEAELETDRPFAELGLNSMMALSIRRETEQLVGIQLSATILWNHPTVASLTEYLAKMLAPQAESEADDVAVPSGSTGSVLDTLFDRIESAPAGTESRT
jgi:phthiocerol/phenolphthiocerol synthesis type-I polyketide synthase A